MTTPTTSLRRARLRRRIAISALALAVPVTTALATGAVFTGQAQTNSTITTSRVDLTASPATTAFNVTGMMPGDTATAPVTVTNSGTTDMRYAMTSQTTEDTLASAVSFVVKTGVTDCTTSGFANSGTVQYVGVFGTTSGTKILGDPAQGYQSSPGGGDRTLAAGGSEVLCMQVAMPDNAPASVTGKTTTATFTFAAEQVANNP